MDTVSDSKITMDTVSDSMHLSNCRTDVMLSLKAASEADVDDRQRARTISEERELNKPIVIM